MPIYTYTCEECDHVHDDIRKLSEQKQPLECPECHANSIFTPFISAYSLRTFSIRLINFDSVNLITFFITYYCFIINIIVTYIPKFFQKFCFDIWTPNHIRGSLSEKHTTF